MSVRLIQIVVEVGGALCVVPVPEDRKDLLLRLLQSVFDDGKIPVVKLPPEYRVERLGGEP